MKSRKINLYNALWKKYLSLDDEYESILFEEVEYFREAYDYTPLNLRHRRKIELNKIKIVILDEIILGSKTPF